MIKLGGISINKLYAGNSEVNKMYLGSELVFDGSGVPVELKPIMTNFRVIEANKDRVYFDTPLGSVSGVDHTDFTISGKSVTAINTTDNYITVSSEFNWWDTSTVRKEGGDISVMYDFYLEYIDIKTGLTEPTATNILWAAETAIGSGNGSSEENAMAYHTAVSSASANTEIRAKAGTGSTTLNFTASGNATQPIKLIGYKNTFGDAASLIRSVGMSFDAAEMPLILNPSGNGIGIGDRAYIIIKNIQIESPTGATEQIYLVDAEGANHCHIENFYGEGSTDCVGVRTKDQSNSEYLRVVDSYIANCVQVGLRLTHSFCLIDNVWVVSSKQSNMDYYIGVNGGVNVGDGNNVVRKCYVERFEGDPNVGHGISMKVSQPTWYLTQNLVENNEVWNCAQSLEAKHQNLSNSVYRGNVTDDNTGTNHSGGIMITNGAHDNVFLNNYCKNGDFGVQFTASTEEVESPDAGKDNVFFNNIFKDNGEGIYLRSDNGGDRKAIGNEFINCVFDGNNTLFNAESNDYASSDNDIKGSIISNNLNDNSTGNNYGFTFSNSNFWSNTSFNVPSGTNILEVDPNYVNTIDYQPQNDLLISFPTDPRNYYDYEGKERNISLTTMASNIDADEEIITPPPPVDNEIFTQDNAASIQTEVNATTGWDATNGDITSDSSDSHDSLYSIKGVSTVLGSAAVRYEFPAVVGKSYDVTYWAKRGAQGTVQTVRGWTNTNENPNIPVDSTTWTQYSTTVTPVADGVIQMRFYMDRTGGAVGDEIYVDQVSVIEY